MQEGFSARYQALNQNQKKAVDTIDGPVMVVAGPGTGKTELLGVRTANIVRSTDTLPSSILCLTFTDSAAQNMRERLIGLMGPDGYTVAVHTFHSFGSEVMNRYSEYFYHGAHFRPADELSTHEVLRELLQKLPHDNKLASTMNGEFTYLRDIQRTISEMKRSGYTPDEITQILDRNDAFCEWVQPRLQPSFAPTLSKKQFPVIAELLVEIQSYDDEPLELLGYRALREHIAATLQEAYDKAVAENSTKPLSAWKRTYMAKNNQGEQTLRDFVRGEKVRLCVGIYYDYLVAMQERELYDYDDMILRVVHAMEVFDDLRYELQERFQYIMVDEFQDTNEAQMRILWNLTNNPASEGRPNVLVVGDDDQAIYRFQGADMSNVLDFTSMYTDVDVITLTDSYRSAAPILETARAVVSQISERLEDRIAHVDKTLTPHHSANTASVQALRYPTTSDSHAALAQMLRDRYSADPTRSRAIIARHHRQLLTLLPQLEHIGVPIKYEYQENVLDSEPVHQLELVARIVVHLASGEYDEANALLPEMLAHPAWGLSPVSLWRLGIAAQQSKRYWLEQMLEDGGQLQDIAEWLIVSGHYSLSEPLETMIDRLFGANEDQVAESAQDDILQESALNEGFVSPYRAYFFPGESLETRPAQYLVWLHTLQHLRSMLRDYRTDHSLRLVDMVRYIDSFRDAGLRMQTSTHIEHDETAISLLTAHKSKGLEFDEVYLLDGGEHVWGDGARSRSNLIQFPSNMPLAPAGDAHDERLRLLFVALTRAKDTVAIILSSELDNGKPVLPIAALDTHVSVDDRETTITQSIAALRNDWQTKMLDVDLTTKEHVLRPLLERYRLSATHLNNFLNIPAGGPELFLLHNLLRFPQAMSPSAAYGSAIHSALHRAHAHMTATGKPRPVEDVLNDFETNLSEYALTQDEYQLLSGRGTKALTQFLLSDTFTPSQVSERSFASDNILVEGARLSGVIDLLDVDTQEKTIFITDYKTGKPSHSWRGTLEYEKIKLHHYEQQLMMYYLLVSQSDQFRDYRITGARLSFVEPDERGEIIALDYDYDEAKLATFRRLIGAVWARIISLDFEQPADLAQSYQAIRDFEADLIA